MDYVIRTTFSSGTFSFPSYVSSLVSLVSPSLPAFLSAWRPTRVSPSLPLQWLIDNRERLRSSCICWCIFPCFPFSSELLKRVVWIPRDHFLSSFTPPSRQPGLFHRASETSPEQISNNLQIAQIFSLYLTEFLCFVSNLWRLNAARSALLLTSSPLLSFLTPLPSTKIFFRIVPLAACRPLYWLPLCHFSYCRSPPPTFMLLGDISSQGPALLPFSPLEWRSTAASTWPFIFKNQLFLLQSLPQLMGCQFK